MFLTGLTVGILVGGFIAIMTFALCVAAKGDDDDE